MKVDSRFDDEDPCASSGCYPAGTAATLLLLRLLPLRPRNLQILGLGVVVGRDVFHSQP